MLKTILLFLLLGVHAMAEEKFESAIVLGELWKQEEIYFQPKNKKEMESWNGTIYYYTAGKCYGLIQKGATDKVVSKEEKCKPAFLKKAKEPYTKIADFKTYEARILKCLAKDDQKCLRGLISKTIQLSFGVDGYQDRRDYLIEIWKKEDFKRLHDLIKQGTVGEGDSRTFPPVVADEGMGYRGEFQKEDGYWLMKYFLAGD